MQGHTGGIGARTFVAETKDYNSIILRFSWVTDDVDDVDSRL